MSHILVSLFNLLLFQECIIIELADIQVEHLLCSGGGGLLHQIFGRVV